MQVRSGVVPGWGNPTPASTGLHEEFIDVAERAPLSYVRRQTLPVQQQQEREGW